MSDRTRPAPARNNRNRPHLASKMRFAHIMFSVQKTKYATRPTYRLKTYDFSYLRESKQITYYSMFPSDFVINKYGYKAISIIIGMPIMKIVFRDPSTSIL